MGRHAGALCALWTGGLRRAVAISLLALALWGAARMSGPPAYSAAGSSTHWFGSSLRWEALYPSPCAGGLLRARTPPRCDQPARAEPPDDGSFDDAIPVLDRWHNPQGLRSTWDVHTLGLWHEASAVLVFDSNSRLLLQQRAASKWTYGGVWDASIAETIEADEPPLAAAIRGAREELDVTLLSAENLRFAASKPVCWRGRMPEMELADCEIEHFFVFRGGQQQQQLDNVVEHLAETAALAARADHAETSSGEPGSGEVSRLRWVEHAALGKEIAGSPQNFSPLLLSAWYECGEGCWGKLAAGEEHTPPPALVQSG